MSRLRIWTDGCCLANPGGAGGWAFVVERRGEVLDERSGSAATSTNNTMELEAAIQALLYAAELPAPTPLEIRSDSQYIVNGATRWLENWKRNGWRRRTRRGNVTKASIANIEYWRRIDALAADLDCSWRWVKGHSGAQFNERADQLAAEAARCAPDLEMVGPGAAR